MTPDKLDELVNKHSGLLGVSGVSQDMRDLLRTQQLRMRSSFIATSRANISARSRPCSAALIQYCVYRRNRRTCSRLCARRFAADSQYLGVELDDARNARMTL